MFNDLTPEQAAVLSLPIVVTPEVWNQAVHFEQPKSLVYLGQRLSNILQATYLEMLKQPTSTSVDFGLFRTLPSGDFGIQFYLELQANLIDEPDAIPYLRISLRPESASQAA